MRFNKSSKMQIQIIFRSTERSIQGNFMIKIG